MKTLALACCLFAVCALAQAPDAGFKPRVVTKGGDKKGIDALYKSFGEAMKKGDVDALAALVDFPMMMMTDDAAGVPTTVMWDRAAWMETMKGSISAMPKDLKLATRTKPTFISDSLAMVEETNERMVGKVKEKWTSASIVELKDGRWMIKAMIEGGWGDAIVPAAAAAEPTRPGPAPAKPAEPVKPAPPAPVKK